MKKLAVIGHPVRHSLSPLIHNYWIAQHGFEGRYDAIDLTAAELQQKFGDLIGHGYTGMNVTIPHKIAVMDLCDELDDSAQKIGAVNTISVSGDGRVKGRNTDAFGFIANIKAQKPDVDFAAGKAVVLGAGGATRAVVYGLLQEGVREIIVTNRTKSKAGEIAEYFGVDVADWDERNDALENAALLVNATSLGMDGQHALEIDLEKLPQHALVADIVYKPLMTDLLQKAQDRDHDIVSGLGMLLHQARPAFEEWFGVMPDVDAELQQKIESEAG